MEKKKVIMRKTFPTDCRPMMCGNSPLDGGDLEVCETCAKKPRLDNFRRWLHLSGAVPVNNYTYVVYDRREGPRK